MEPFSMDSFRLDGQVAVVTGGAGIYGTGFCLALAAAGATVVVTSRTLSTAEEAAASIAEQSGGTVAGMVLDQGDRDSIATFGTELRERFGQVDVLVNNAVQRAGAGLFETTAEDWESTSVVNSRGLFLVTQAVVAMMVEQGSGSIINIGSIYGVVAPDATLYEGTPVHPYAFYSYDKAGMAGFTRYLAGELGPHGIRVNYLAPGGYNQSGESSEFSVKYGRRTALRRMALDHDVSGAVVFLASSASAYITGTTIPVDGGWTAH